MSIQIGEKIPQVPLKIMASEGPEDIHSHDLTAKKRVVIFAVPGAFTPGCSNTHLPGYVVNVDAIKAKGIDAVICISVNDAFVMGAWGKAQNAEHLQMVADGNAEFASALGLTMDASAWGMGTRSKRYAMIVNDGTVEALQIDEDGGVNLSSAENILSLL